jgi:hypothetical protein
VQLQQHKRLLSSGGPTASAANWRKSPDGVRTKSRRATRRPTVEPQPVAALNLPAPLTTLEEPAWFETMSGQVPDARVERY